jgi:hypothetical protein
MANNNNSSTSGITIRDVGDAGSSTTSSSPKKASGASSANNIGADSFEQRAGLFGLSAKQCEDLNKDQIAPKGSAYVKMRPVCANADGESIDLMVGCDDLSGEISVSPNLTKDTIDSQCEGKMRSRYSGMSVEVKIPVYLDRLMNNPDLLAAIHYGSAIAETTANSKTYEAFGIGKELFRAQLPRYYVEIVPQESDGVGGILFYPYCELGMAEIGPSFGKGSNRTATITLTASMPEYDLSEGGMPPVISGLWRQK